MTINEKQKQKMIIFKFLQVVRTWFATLFNPLGGGVGDGAQNEYLLAD
jgi:hypothetical protein